MRECGANLASLCPTGVGYHVFPFREILRQDGSEAEGAHVDLEVET